MTLKVLITFLIGALALATENKIEVEKVAIYSNSSRSQALWDLRVRGLLSLSMQFPESFYVVVTIKKTSDSKNFVSQLIPQVGLLFTIDAADASHMPIGTLQSIQIPLRSSGNAHFEYSGTVSLSNKRQFDPTGGRVMVELLVAGLATVAPIRMNLGKLTIVPSSTRASVSVPENSKVKYIPELSAFHAKPLHAHPFAPPEPRASPFTSAVFSVLTVAIAPAMFIGGLSRIGGLNAKGLSNGLSVLFAAGLLLFVGIVGLFFWFWNLVETSAAAIVLSIVMVLVGNRVLCQIRSSHELEF